MKHTLSFTKIATTYVLWWGFWIFAVEYLLYHYTGNVKAAIIDSLLLNILLAIGGIIIFNTLKYYQPAKENMFYLRIWAILAGVGITFMHDYLLAFIISDATYMDMHDNTFLLRLCYSLLMLAIVTILNWLYFYFKEVQEVEARKNNAENLVKEAELSKLRQQLQPHFLFNSLNSINALVGTKPELAREMIQKLSEFLRGTIKKGEQQFVNFEEELKHLNLYLDIEKVRFGHRLSTSIETEEDCNSMKIPLLLLQPIVENAIKFGLYDTTGEIEIKIIVTSEKNMLKITVQNPYDAHTSANTKGTGYGLDSVKRRLQLMYLRSDLLIIKKEENLFSTTILIPQNYDTNNTN